MPFKSKKQETFLRINYPEIARKWVKESKKFNKVSQTLTRDYKEEDGKVKKDERYSVMRADNLPNMEKDEGVFKTVYEDRKKKKFRKVQGKTKYGSPLQKEIKVARNKKDVYKAVLNRKTSKKNNQTVKVKKENGKTTTTTTSSGTVRGTGKTISSPTTSKDGVYSTTKRMQVHTPEGKRWYEGTGKSRDYGFSQTKARFNAQTKPVTDPADSLVTGGVDPVFTQPETKKKKKKKDKKRFWQLKK